MDHASFQKKEGMLSAMEVGRNGDMELWNDRTPVGEVKSVDVTVASKSVFVPRFKFATQVKVVKERGKITILYCGQTRDAVKQADPHDDPSPRKSAASSSSLLGVSPNVVQKAVEVEIWGCLTLTEEADRSVVPFPDDGGDDSNRDVSDLESGAAAAFPVKTKLQMIWNFRLQTTKTKLSYSLYSALATTVPIYLIHPMYRDVRDFLAKQRAGIAQRFHESRFLMETATANYTTEEDGLFSDTEKLFMGATNMSKMIFSDMFVSAKSGFGAIPASKSEPKERECLVFRFEAEVDASIYDCASWDWNIGTAPRWRFFHRHGGESAQAFAKSDKSRVVKEVRDLLLSNLLGGKSKRSITNHEVWKKFPGMQPCILVCSAPTKEASKFYKQQLKSSVAVKGDKMLGLSSPQAADAQPASCYKKTTFLQLPDLLGKFPQTRVTIEVKLVQDATIDDMTLSRHFGKYYVGLLSRMRVHFRQDNKIDEGRRNALLGNMEFWESKTTEDQDDSILAAMNLSKQFLSSTEYSSIDLLHQGPEELELAEFDNTIWSKLEMHVSATAREILAFLWTWDNRCLTHEASDGYESDRKIEVVKSNTKQVVNTCYALEGGTKYLYERRTNTTSAARSPFYLNVIICCTR